MQYALGALLFGFWMAAASAAETTVFAAASLTDALTEVARGFHDRSGDTVHFSFAASSTLARQIESGAPASLFFSADEQWMDYLAQRKLVLDNSRRDLLGNRLVLVAPADSARNVDIKPGFDIVGLLGADGRLVTGDPDSVPVGRYARDALVALGVWEATVPRLVRADSVRSALAFVERGEAPLGIVYATDAAISPKVRVVGTFPESTHKPVTYPVALVSGQDSEPARAFLRYVQEAPARRIFERYGFTVLTQR